MPENAVLERPVGLETDTPDLERDESSAGDSLDDAPDVELEDAIEQLHGVHCAAHAHLLRILAEYDDRAGYRNDGAPSADAWVRCRVQVSLKTAREWVRVAVALRQLPLVMSAYADGRLSWDKVRELVKFATPETEAELVEHAIGCTAEMVAYLARRARVITARDAEAAYDRRGLSWHWDSTRELFHLRARLAAPDGEIVAKALDRLADKQPKDTNGFYVEPHVRLADALVELASTRLVDAQDADRAVVVIHADAAVVASGIGNAELESGTTVAAETLDRLMCDAHVETVVHGEHGETVGIGWRSRNIPGWLMRQVRARDQGCRFPGCGRRRMLNGHHLERWPDGPTNLDNLAALCRFHHHLVHEGRWSIRGHPDRNLEFIRPDGRVFEPGPRMLREEVRARVPVPALLL